MYASESWKNPHIESEFFYSLLLDPKIPAPLNKVYTDSFCTAIRVLLRIITQNYL